MKLKLWICIWFAIIVFCVIFGLATKASNSELSPDQNVVLNSYYGYSPDMATPQELSKTNYSMLASQSQLIVTCRFDGEREMQNKCYLSEVQVTDVVKGDRSLQGQKIKIYEPVFTQYEDLDQFKIVNNFDEYVKKFNWQGKTRVIVSAPYEVSNTNDYTIMAQNQDYLLFLNSKPIFQGQKQSGEPEYVQLDNPYAKLTISDTDASTYKPPADIISLKESMQYEILLTDASSIKSYFSTKMEILKQLHLISSSN